MNTTGRRVLLALALAATLPAVAVRGADAVATNRPSSWAQPIEKPGLPNFHKVTDQLYRGAQPTAEGFRQLQALGIKTAVNLRSFHADRDEMGGSRLGAEHIFFKTWHAEDEEVVRFLQIVTDTNRTPVFVHCQHGADRTGLMCAIYRMAVCGWTKDQAIAEMTGGGFGFHPEWQNLIRYIRELDMVQIEKLAGRRESPAPAQ